MKLGPWLFGLLIFCVAVVLTHGTAKAPPPSNCTSNTLSSGGVNSIALGSSFQPPALTPGAPISATITGSCKNLTANSVTIAIDNGTDFSSTFGYRGVLCGACAGPSPFNSVYYQIYESDGVTPLPSGGVNVACSAGNCTSGAGGTYTYTVVFKIVTPNGATSLNDAQIGSYTDASLTTSITGSGDQTPASIVTPVNASVTQDCVLSILTNIAFGAYNPLTVTIPTPATGDVQIMCTRGSSGITFSVGPGNNSTHAASPSTRAMVGAAHGDYLSYDIFEDSGYATRYPTSNISQSITGGITTPSVIPMYGQIPLPAQNVSADSYSDSVLTTVNF